ncbi:MAG: laminin B domain-containing protein [Pseudomonadota bacterium]
MKLIQTTAAVMAVAAFACPAAAATIIAESRFSESAEGWRQGDFTGGNVTYALAWNPAGHVVADDSREQFTAFLAPSAYRGDRRDAFGGALAFDLATAIPPDVGRVPYVTLQGAGRLLFGLLTDVAPGEAFSRYAIVLRPENFFLGSPEEGPGSIPASEALFLQVLRDLDQLSIRADLADGPDQVLLDNVVLTAGAGVPEPQTWALMIAGFGLAGAALRRVRAWAWREV